MTKQNKITFYIEGPDWEDSVEIDTEVFSDDSSQLIEAGTRSLEKQIKENDKLNIGAIVLVKKGKKNAKKEAMVNAYICLNNASQYLIAETLRENFKNASGQDLSADTNGFSF